MITSSAEIEITWNIRKNYIRALTKERIPIASTPEKKSIKFMHFSLGNYPEKQKNIISATQEQTEFAQALLTICFEGIPVIYFVEFSNGLIYLTKSSAISWTKVRSQIENVFMKHVLNVKF